ncbi:uncharacterized protein LOC125677494 isoform X2 [Ostrea edulis]|nr:uncharacterized protein LOC125677494 isoform X2 [Ostrea edulis]XP_056015154.1 uncharacterized protein LOC125677494 isoform X2 [Ostrea edulis]
MYDTTLYKIKHTYKVECGSAATVCPNTYISTEAHLLAPCPSLVNLTFEITQPTISTPHDTNDRYWIIVSSAIVITITILISCLLWIRRRRCTRVPRGDEETTLPLLQRTFTNKEVVKVLGEYDVWKTSISDQFSSLSDDEVYVLFCFLWSDSGTPDFTDTDCLDILNKIRKEVYRRDSVTSEEAQRTLDGLKSRGFLWDQDGVHITKKAKEETMYRVIGRGIELKMTLNVLYYMFSLSSYTIAVRYLRLREYTRKSGERCVISNDSDCDSLLIRRLQMNILTHVTMKDTSFCDEVSRYLNIPLNKVRTSKGKRRAFLEELQQTGECVQYRGGSQGSVQHVKWLWRYDFNDRPDIVRSCIGPHPHWDIYIINNTAYRKHSQYHDCTPAERCLLYCLLMVNDASNIKVYNAIRERYFTELPFCDEITATNTLGKIIHVENDVIKFRSDDIRHGVMYAFVTECLVEDSDLKFFLTTASRDMISEYCRLWGYKRSEGEKCLYIPNEMYELFIDRLQLDILTHCTMSDEGIHYRISKRLNVPEEVMKWDIDARRRYVKSSKEQGRKKLYCARGMLVGCAGAGKTTLLRKLQNRETADRPTETTVGLEVHEDLLEIESGTLKNYKGESSVFHSDKQLISMTDFAGQVAYYACHQVYLSRRAFYMLVVDMSKNLTEKVHEHNKDRHDPSGSLFHNWTYDDYIVFWLQCIKTYCDVGKRRIRGREIERENGNPVILIASHKDEADSGQQTSNFFWELRKSLPKGLALTDILLSDKYFEVECPPRSLNNEEKKAIENVKECVVKTVMQLPQWGEEIPLNWIKLAHIFKKKKREGERIMKRNALQEMEEFEFSAEQDIDDMLRFFHEIGHVLYFADKKLKDTIIINVQWFVDAFKYIITDRKHIPGSSMACDEWMRTGRISESTFQKIWMDSGDESYAQYQEDILPYMQRLGLMTKKLTDSENKQDMHYVPSMNRVEFSEENLDVINRGDKTPVLIFHFKTYLPHFFFFRLVVSCLEKWTALDQDMFCKSAAFYKTGDYTHCIAIAVNKTSILLQVFTPGKRKKLQTGTVVEIRNEVEKFVEEITKTFHDQVGYEIGYSCKDVPITIVDENYFLSESEVLAFEDDVTCPKHVKAKSLHDVNRRDLIGCWRSDI